MRVQAPSDGVWSSYERLAYILQYFLRFTTARSEVIILYRVRAERVV